MLVSYFDTGYRSRATRYRSPSQHQPTHMCISIMFFTLYLLFGVLVPITLYLVLQGLLSEGQFSFFSLHFRFLLLPSPYLLLRLSINNRDFPHRLLSGFSFFPFPSSLVLFFPYPFPVWHSPCFVFSVFPYPCWSPHPLSCILFPFPVGVNVMKGYQCMTVLLMYTLTPKRSSITINSSATARMGSDFHLHSSFLPP